MKVKESYKKTVVETGLTMLEEGLTVGTWGNISVRDPETGLVYISPSGMNYREIGLDDVVVLDLEMNLVDGTRVPSIEKETHLAVYRARADVNAVVHTHPLYSTVLGVNKMELPAVSEDFAQIVGDKIICSEYALPGTQELGQNVAAGLGAERNAVLLPNHGTINVGEDMKTALIVCHVVEKSAQIYIMALNIGTPHLISAEDIKAMQDYKNNYYGQR
ncbi:MAG: class II aldolase/adducin family protein [Anaerolineae bacterium]|jgi:L-fuculose-phosphate aldolase|nr:class II aldolase/adducin family protein [Anaerolineae bacterium]MBT7071026.1 class II aldolase/adducin family protein [Anaerolineae bacterium]MBT7323732.1 class II aldolase/adducin family protein [Anaerolineae bacterium]